MEKLTINDSKILYNIVQQNLLESLNKKVLDVDTYNNILIASKLLAYYRGKIEISRKFNLIP